MLGHLCRVLGILEMHLQLQDPQLGAHLLQLFKRSGHAA